MASMASIPWAAGTQLGPYELLAPLGAGGMGEVWKARDTRIDRTVAIKRLKAAHLERFKREARAIAALNHPHICQLYDLGPDYLVMEYVEGVPISSPLPAAEAVRLAIQIAAALEEAHGKGIIHRDLKPANILNTSKGVKLLDFGLAKMEAATASADDTLSMALTEPGMIMGTVAYMSPEQAQGLPVDARSDVFSFGAVLYEMLSGRRAFRGQTAIATITAVVKEDPAPVSASPAIQSIVGRCLAKQPSQRFQTIAEVKTALEQVGQTEDAPRPSIAVLPFANMSGDKEQEYFSDGLAEEIINVLAHIPDLRVIARTSAFAFKGQNTDIRKIAETLGVTHVLEGSVRKAGNRVRVTGQLITAHDGSHIWSERFDREMEDVFAIQDEIAGAIASALKMRLSPDAAARRHTPPLPAWEAMLKARHYMQKWTPDSLARAKQSYLEATQLDQQFALAHAELGLLYFVLACEGQVTAPEAAARMQAEAREALALDPSLAEALAVLALVAVLDYNWKEAGRQFDLALAREALSPLVRYFYSAFYLCSVGRMQEAMEQVKRALREDPLNVLLRICPGEYLLAEGDPAGEASLLKVLELNENAWIAMLWLAAFYVTSGRTPEAQTLAARAYDLVLNATGFVAGFAKLSGDGQRAEALLAVLGSTDTYGVPAHYFIYYMVCGELDVAAGWLQKMIEQRDTRAPWLLPHLFGLGFTASPYWPKLAKMMNLPSPASNDKD